VLEPGRAPLAERLGILLQALTELIARSRAQAVAVETAFCGHSARSALVLGQARGVALATAARAGLPVFEYAPAEVKLAFCGNGRAEKEQMVRSARALLGLEALRADAADALAVAVCHLARHQALPRPRPARAARARLRPAIRRAGGAG